MIEVPAPTLVEAQRLVRALNRALFVRTADGDDSRPLPRCEHPRWRGSDAYVRQLLRKRGRVVECTCKASHGDGVDPDCPHVQHGYAVERDEAGAGYVVRMKDADLAVATLRDPELRADAREGRIEPREAAGRREDNDALVVWSELEDLRERRAAVRETEPAPAPERGARR